MAGNARTQDRPRGARGAVLAAAGPALALALSGCALSGDGAGGGLLGAPRAAQAAGEREVEAPEIFQLAAQGLWDGRPSLGGVWVAHADVTDPERVVVRNPASGQQVNAALFRRERENPGPSVQVSADAAAALGMLAGQPTDLEIVALRREAVEAPGAAETSPDDPENGAADGAPEATSLADGAAAAPAEEPRRRGFFGLFTRRAAPAEPAPAPSAIETAVLDGAPGAAAPAPPAPPASSLDRPFIQAASFAQRDGADRAAGVLRDAGMAAEVRQDTGAGGNVVWRVLAGPAASTAERDSLLVEVRRLGFTDAFPARG